MSDEPPASSNLTEALENAAHFSWQGALILLVALPLLYFLSRLLHALLKNRMGEHRSVVVQKSFFFVGFVALCILALNLLGIDLSTLLGAAGIASIAIGFAAQTSLSNVISGVFLYWEKPFELGDIVRTGTTTGVVMAIDLMSVKLRTFDNQFVRIPNETMVKAEVTTISKFPVRRMDLTLLIDHRVNISRLKTILEDIAAKNAYTLDQPTPTILFRAFNENGLDVLFGVWFEKSQFLDTRNSLMQEIQERFVAEKISFGWPRRELSWHPSNSTEALSEADLETP